MADERDSLFAKLVVEQGLAKPEHVEECRRLQERLAAAGSAPIPGLGELLLRKGYLSPSQFADTIQRTTAPGTRMRKAAPAPLPPEVEAASREPGNAIGRYVKVSKLGAGGMGEVWRGWDRDLNRWVALKFLKSDEEGELARFEREAQTAAQLSHPNIAAVYEVGHHADKPFIAMQLVPGRTLAAFPRNDVRLLARLLRDAALAVHHAHERGIIHRDLKPHNIMVEGGVTRDQELRVYVMDFGLAKQAEGQSSLSVAGSVLGTPAYMPPEQARGRLDEVDARSDVYSLGATLYELLAGRTVFKAANVFDLLDQVANADPAPIRASNPRIPADLETIAMKCLEKDRARRYDSARALADDLGRWLDGEAILAHPPSAGYRLLRFLQRRKTILIPSAAALVIAAAFAGWAAAGSAGRARRVRESLAIGAAEEKAGRLGAARDAYRTVLDLGEHAPAREGFERVDALLRARAAAQKSEEEALKLLESARPALEGAQRLLYRKGVRFDELAREVERARPVLEQAVAKAPGLVQGHLLLGRVWALQGWSDKAEACWRKALELDPTFAPARFQLGRLLLERSYLLQMAVNEEEGKRQLPRALEVEREAAGHLEKARGASGADEEVQSAVLAGMTSLSRKDAEAVDRICREGIARFGSREGVEELHWMQAMVTPGQDERRSAFGRALDLRPGFVLALLQRGYDSMATAMLSRRPSVARPYYEAAVADFDVALAINPRLPSCLLNRGACRANLGRSREALADFDEALRIDPVHHPVYNNRALTREHLKDLKGAYADFTLAIERVASNATAYGNRGNILLKQKKVDEALADFEAAIAADPGHAPAYYGRASIRRLRQDGRGAREDLDRAIELEPDYHRAYGNRAILRSMSGDAEGALADFSKAIELQPEYPDAYANRGLFHLQARRDRAAAIADLEMALKVAPPDWPGRAAVERELAALKSASQF